MRIVIFNPLRDTRVRGISRYASELARYLSLRGHDVHELVFPSSWARLPRALEVPLLIAWEQLVLPLEAARRRADLVIDPYNSYSIAGAALHDTLCVYHDFLAVEGRRWLLKPSALYQRILHLTARCMPRLRVGCISAPVMRAARRYVPRKTAVLLPNVVTALSADDRPCEVGDALVEELRRMAGEGFLTVCTVSSESRNKDFDGLVGALADGGRRVHLLAFGFGESSTAERAARGVAGGAVVVRRVGRVPGVTISRCIRESDVFVFHSRAEGFGRPVVEALLERKVVVTAEVPALEMLSEGALANVVVYRELRDLWPSIEAARARPFRAFEKVEARGIEEAIQQAMEASPPT